MCSSFAIRFQIWCYHICVCTWNRLVYPDHDTWPINLINAAIGGRWRPPIYSKRSHSQYALLPTLMGHFVLGQAAPPKTFFEYGTGRTRNYNHWVIWFRGLEANTEKWNSYDYPLAVMPGSRLAPTPSFETSIVWMFGIFCDKPISI